jgi:hypothetical protein
MPAIALPGPTLRRPGHRQEWIMIGWGARPGFPIRREIE